IFGVATAQGTRLLRHPTVSRDSVAFEYAGDLWVVSRSGGQAGRLSAAPGGGDGPYFSPYGAQDAFRAAARGETARHGPRARGGAGGGARRGGAKRGGGGGAGGWLPVVRRVSSHRAAPALPNNHTSGSGQSAWKAGFRSRSRCLARSAASILPTVDDSRMRKSRPHSFRNGTRPVCGGITGVAARTRSKS